MFDGTEDAAAHCVCFALAGAPSGVEFVLGLRLRADGAADRRVGVGKQIEFWQSIDENCNGIEGIRKEKSTEPVHSSKKRAAISRG